MAISKMWKDLMAKDEFVFFMNLMRVITLLLVCVLIWYMFANIEQVKLLGTDACKLCMEKSGCTCNCFSPSDFVLP